MQRIVTLDSLPGVDIAGAQVTSANLPDHR